MIRPRVPELDPEKSWPGAAFEPVRLGRMVAASPPMREVLSQLAALAGSDLPVLIEGGPGSGKSLAALTLCEFGMWARFPRLEIDLAAPGSPFDEGLFQIRALAQRGRGTLVIESVEILSPDRQRTLTHLLDEITPAESAIRVRVIATSRRELRTEVARGRFRADLYYRLRGALLRLPTAAGGPTESGHRGGPEANDPNPTQEKPGDLREFRRRQERALVLEALEAVHWNVSAAARGLGLSRVGLSKKMKVLGLSRPKG